MKEIDEKRERDRRKRERESERQRNPCCPYALMIIYLIKFLKNNTTPKITTLNGFILLIFNMTNTTKKVKLVSLVEGGPKALFSIPTTSRCWEGCTSILWIAPLYP